MELQVSYIKHSGYVIELDDNILIFDYYEGELPCGILKKDKKITVFSSHSHGDHYNPKILDWCDINNKIKYVFSTDIVCDHSCKINYIKPLDIKRVNDNEIFAFDSTDLGVSFLVKVEGINIFHAGDLNFWHWRSESTEDYVINAKAEFVKILDTIKNHTVDIAMFPTDPRMGEGYYEGSDIFIECIKPKVFIPMHFIEAETNLQEFVAEMSRYKNTNILVPNKQGQQFIL
jgi:L-ascorbate metabolism protein UlaG (beta-lactamase superfamily)